MRPLGHPQPPACSLVVVAVAAVARRRSSLVLQPRARPTASSRERRRSRPRPRGCGARADCDCRRRPSDARGAATRRPARHVRLGLRRRRAARAPAGRPGTLDGPRPGARGARRRVRGRRRDTRLYAAPIVSNGRRLGDRRQRGLAGAVRDSRRTALVASLALAALVCLRRRARRALAARGVAAARGADDGTGRRWSERDLDRRFGLGEPHDELTQLAATLDGLLDRLAASLRHEQRFSAELSHELRTPLARLLTPRPSSRCAGERAPRGVPRGARGRPSRRRAPSPGRSTPSWRPPASRPARSAGPCDAQSVATHAVEACAALAEERGLELSVEQLPHPLRLGVELELAERILQPLVENACRYGRSAFAIGRANERRRRLRGGRRRPGR